MTWHRMFYVQEPEVKVKFHVHLKKTHKNPLKLSDKKCQDAPHTMIRMEFGTSIEDPFFIMIFGSVQ